MSEQTQLVPVKREESAVALRDPESILRYAIDKGANVETIERLMAVRRELKAEQAKEMFDAAMRDFQADCPVVRKDRGVPDRSGSVAYKYAPLEDIIAQVKPHLQRHGFSYTLDTDTESQERWVIAKCHVTHCGGHCQSSTAKFPLGTKTGIMSDTQVYAAALTFASRRVFCNAFGIVTAGEDMDGRTEKAKPAGPSTLHGDKAPTANDAELKRKLVDLTRSVSMVPKGYALDESAKGRLTGYLVDELILADEETVSDLAGARLAEVVAKVEKKLKG